MKPSWKKYLLYGSLIIVGGWLIFMLVETIRAKNTGFDTKTLWDWMELLIIPFVLAIGAFFLNKSERSVELAISKDRQQEDALQNYIDRMENLLLKEDLHDPPNEEVQKIARTRTLAVLRSLDPKRKGFVLSFLYEADLINTGSMGISLVGADLRGIDLTLAYLHYADLRGAKMIKAKLHGAELINVEMQYADLRGADFRFAENMPIFIGWKFLMSRIYSLLPGKTKLHHANLRGADLRGAKLSFSEFCEANLRDVDMRGADLHGVDLSGADLLDAKVTAKQLSTVYSLKGATMPDGTIHE